MYKVIDYVRGDAVDSTWEDFDDALARALELAEEPLAKKLLVQLKGEMRPGMSTYRERTIARRIRRVLTITQDPFELRQADSRAADIGRRLAALAGCPSIWRGTVWYDSE